VYKIINLIVEIRITLIIRIILANSYFDALIIVINFVKNPEGIEQ